MLSLIRKLIAGKSEEKPVSVFQETYDRLQHLDLSKFKRVYQPKFSLVEVNVFEKNIELYLEFLRGIFTAFKENTQINVASFNKYQNTVYLYDFYLDKDGNYVNPVVLTTELIELIEGILRSYEDLKQSGDSAPFPNRHNIRITIKLIPQLQSLVEVLAKIAQ